MGIAWGEQNMNQKRFWSVSPLYPKRRTSMTDRTIDSPPRRPRGRPSRYAAYDQLLASLPLKMKKRPIYRDQIGLFRGTRKVTVWVKLRLPGGGAKEIKLGDLASWP